MEKLPLDFNALRYLTVEVGPDEPQRRLKTRAGHIGEFLTQLVIQSGSHLHSKQHIKSTQPFYQSLPPPPPSFSQTPTGSEALLPALLVCSFGKVYFPITELPVALILNMEVSPVEFNESFLISLEWTVTNTFSPSESYPPVLELVEVNFLLVLRNAKLRAVLFEGWDRNQLVCHTHPEHDQQTYSQRQCIQANQQQQQHPQHSL